MSSIEGLGNDQESLGLMEVDLLGRDEFVAGIQKLQCEQLLKKHLLNYNLLNSSKRSTFHLNGIAMGVGMALDDYIKNNHLRGEAKKKVRGLVPSIVALQVDKGRYGNLISYLEEKTYHRLDMD